MALTLDPNEFPFYGFDNRRLQPVRRKKWEKIDWNKLVEACERVTKNQTSIWIVPKKTKWDEDFEELFEI